MSMLALGQRSDSRPYRPSWGLGNRFKTQQRSFSPERVNSRIKRADMHFEGPHEVTEGLYKAENCCDSS